ncbi:MAG TPA: cyclic nucleotide-binding domain-containing protein [Chitinispirillaceae bacterium]|nr:cyclic nucleotide-binding domain-containing protein [Chitinispirillaceae bacterium]
MKPITRIFKPGKHLFHENDRSRELYIIQNGSVKVYRCVAGKEIELAILKNGAVLGEMALIDGKPRSASARAIEESTVIIIDADTFHDKMRGVPSWFLSIIRMTSNKIRLANKRLQNITNEHQGANIIITISHLNSRFNQNGLGLDLTKLQLQLIQLLGVTHQKVVRIIDFLQQHGFITLSSTHLSIKDASKMNDYCEFLRYLIRKSYERMLPHDDDIYKLIINVSEQYPEISMRDDFSTIINGSILWNFMQQNQLTDEYEEILDLLEALNLFSVKRDFKEKGSNPIAGSTFSINNLNWKKMYLYSKYSCLTPSV